MVDIRNIRLLRFNYSLESFKSLWLFAIMKAGLYCGLTEEKVANINKKRVEHLDLASLCLSEHEHTAIENRIFQTWKSTTTMPSNYRYWRASIAEQNPSWTLILSDDKANREFIDKYFSWFLETYDRFPREIYRADAVRPFLLLAFGGVYLDMDVECLRPIRLDGEADIVLGQMGKDHNLLYSIPNAMMASKPNMLLWAIYISLMQRYACAPWKEPEDVTGPNVLKMAVDLYRSGTEESLRKDHAGVVKRLEQSLKRKLIAGSLTVLPCHDWYPFNWDDPIQKRLRRILVGNRAIIGKKWALWLFPKATFVTYWTHSW